MLSLLMVQGAREALSRFRDWNAQSIQKPANMTVSDRACLVRSQPIDEVARRPVPNTTMPTSGTLDASRRTCFTNGSSPAPRFRCSASAAGRNRLQNKCENLTSGTHLVNGLPEISEDLRMKQHENIVGSVKTPLDRKYIVKTPIVFLSYETFRFIALRCVSLRCGCKSASTLCRGGGGG